MTLLIRVHCTTATICTVQAGCKLPWDTTLLIRVHCTAGTICTVKTGCTIFLGTRHFSFEFTVQQIQNVLYRQVALTFWLPDTSLSISLYNMDCTNFLGTEHFSFKFTIQYILYEYVATLLGTQHF